MKPGVLAIVLPLCVLADNPQAVAADGLCAPLRAFIASVKPGEIHSLSFHTIWGGGFKGSDESSFYEKGCEQNSYEPAKGVCADLMENGSVEFAGENAKRAISCLSTKTRFSSGTLLHGISFSMTVGTDNRGSHVDIRYAEDEEWGGMVLTIIAHGY